MSTSPESPLAAFAAELWQLYNTFVYHETSTLRSDLLKVYQAHTNLAGVGLDDGRQIEVVSSVDAAIEHLAVKQLAENNSGKPMLQAEDIVAEALGDQPADERTLSEMLEYAAEKTAIMHLFFFGENPLNGLMSLASALAAEARGAEMEKIILSDSVRATVLKKIMTPEAWRKLGIRTAISLAGLSASECIKVADDPNTDINAVINQALQGDSPEFMMMKAETVRVARGFYRWRGREIWGAEGANC